MSFAGTLAIDRGVSVGGIAEPPPRQRLVLHVGCGHFARDKLHAAFRAPGWRETRLDIDAEVKPDILCSLHDMAASVAASSYDALWSSHSIEHLHAHEVAPAFGEFVRVLRPDGFALIRCPDLEAIAQELLRSGPDETAYLSPAGAITPLDMLYGHARSIANGHSYMRHHTGFTAKRLGRLLLEAGFAEVHTRTSSDYDLWAVAFMPEARRDAILDDFALAGFDFDP